jgi:hypothetical protein
MLSLLVELKRQDLATDALMAFKILDILYKSICDDSAITVAIMLSMLNLSIFFMTCSALTKLD